MTNDRFFFLIYFILCVFSHKRISPQQSSSGTLEEGDDCKR